MEDKEKLYFINANEGRNCLHENHLSSIRENQAKRLETSAFRIDAIIKLCEQYRMTK